MIRMTARRTFGLLAWVALTLAPAGAGASSARTAEQALLAHLHGEGGVSVRDGYDPGFVRLDHDNQQLMDGVDVLDEDPACNCQDNAGAAYQIKTVRADASRHLIQVWRPKEKKTPPWTVEMRLIGGAWKIYDVVSASGHSVRAELVRHNTCAREHIARHQDVTPCALLP
jgi:hypothetical protein